MPQPVIWARFFSWAACPTAKEATRATFLTPTFFPGGAGWSFAAAAMWSYLLSAVAAPSARFVQWKAVLHPGDAAPRVDSVTLNYLPKNVAPEFDDVTVIP